MLTSTPPQVVIQTTPPTVPTIPALITPTASTTPTSIVVSPSSPIAQSNMKISMISGPQPHLKPWTGSSLEPRRFKPISVENWGIFLLNRLHDYYQKKEYTDLTLRFPSRNAQIKVHKAVVNACSDYFAKAEADGLVANGQMDMPSSFLPELVSPAIRFMYTGRMDLKNHNVVKLKETAAALGMPLLSKLIEAQINAPISEEKASKPRRTSMDPVRQIRKIKKIEKKFEKDLKKEKFIQQQEAEKKANVVSDKFLPGKKLPIWKKRVTQTNTQNTQQTPSQTMTQDEKLHLINVNTRNYGKVTKEQVKMPRQLREIQENLNFDKVRQTTVTENDTKKDMNIDEIKEFMEEQRNRNNAFNDEDDDDDYYDNDAGLDYDEAEGEDDEMELPEPNVTPVKLTPAKPILKSAEKEASVPRKSVRFSLRPAGSSINNAAVKVTETELITPDDTTNEAVDDQNIADDEELEEVSDQCFQLV